MLERAAESRGTHPIAGSGMEVSPPHGTYSHQQNHRPPTKFDFELVRFLSDLFDHVRS